MRYINVQKTYKWYTCGCVISVIPVSFFLPRFDTFMKKLLKFRVTYKSCCSSEKISTIILERKEAQIVSVIFFRILKIYYLSFFLFLGDTLDWFYRYWTINEATPTQTGLTLPSVTLKQRCLTFSGRSNTARPLQDVIFLSLQHPLRRGLARTKKFTDS